MKMIRSSKVCFRCGKRKRLTSFYPHPGMADLHLNKCKVCARTDVKANRLLKLEQYRAYDKQRSQLEHRKALDAERHRRHRLRFPGREKTRQKTSNARRSGRLTPGPCVFCGSTKTDAHHQDYRKPYDVIWLCRDHHSKLHSGKLAI